MNKVISAWNNVKHYLEQEGSKVNTDKFEQILHSLTFTVEDEGKLLVRKEDTDDELYTFDRKNGVAVLTIYENRIANTAENEGKREHIYLNGIRYWRGKKVYPQQEEE